MSEDDLIKRGGFTQREEQRREKKGQDTEEPRKKNIGLTIFTLSSMALGALMLSKRLGKGGGHEL